VTNRFSLWHYAAVGALVVAGVLALTLPGVFASHASARRDIGVVPISSTILIGSVGGTSGVYSSTGVPALDGGLLAVSDVNRQGGVLGKRLTLQSYDDEASATLAASLFRRLAKAGAVAVLGSGDSGAATALAADDLHIPDLGVTDVSAGLSPWVWSSGASTSAAGAVDGAYALKSCRGLALLSGTTTADRAGAAAVRLAYTRAHKALVVNDTVGESSPAGAAASLAKDIGEIKRSGSGCVITWLTAQDTASVAQTLRARHVHVTLIGDGGIVANTTYPLLAGAAAGGTLATELTAQSHPGAALVKFEKSYLKRFHMEASADAISSYDAVLMLAAAIKQEHSTSAAKLRAALNGLSGSPELQGAVTFTKGDHSAVSAEQLTLVSYDAAAKAWKPVN
jgi:branched-chain amino acid transport system substrate-binding protein